MATLHNPGERNSRVRVAAAAEDLVPAGAVHAGPVAAVVHLAIRGRVVCGRVREHPAHADLVLYLRARRAVLIVLEGV